MNHKLATILIVTLVVLLLLAGGVAAQQESPVSPSSELAVPMSSAFTYQGRLQDDSGPVNSLCDFEFKMFASSEGSDEVWGTVPRYNLLVNDGYFTVDDLAFPGIFQGEARFIEISVRCPAGEGSFENLSPRQELTAVPYAFYAYTARNTWELDGNMGTSPGLNFLGTIDYQALELHVYGQRALRLEPATSPNVIGGYSGNYVTLGVIGAAIGGGGDNNNPNRVTDYWSTVAGGLNNRAGDGTGLFNSAQFATIGGGRNNLANGLGSTIGGGQENVADHQNVTIGGGSSNFVDGSLGTIAGGLGNQITNGEQNTISGGNLNFIDGRFAVIGGGSNNIVSGMNATIGGGGAANNTFSNHATGDYSTISGGVSNFATADYATIGGGGNIVPSDPASGNLVSDDYGTVGGGGNNQAGDGAGTSDDRSFATVSGGRDNTASGTASIVGGGDSNTASGWRSTVPGGVGNIAAGDHSLAAGRRAKIVEAADGSFVWSDGNDFDTVSWNPNEFVARATGGFYFISGINSSGGIDSGTYLDSGGTQWLQLSDRNSKTSFEQVDGREVVARLAEISIPTWQYISQPEDIRHMGPMAQDFYDAFGLGEDEKYIGTLDADGVSLAAIQGLYTFSQEHANQIQDLQTENEALRHKLGELEERVSLLEGGANPSPSHTYSPWVIFLLFSLGLVAVLRTKHWTLRQED